MRTTSQANRAGWEEHVDGLLGWLQAQVGGSSSGGFVRYVPQGSALRSYPSGQQIRFVQGGTIATPATESLFSIQPTDPLKAPFSILINATLFNSTQDTLLSWGYNMNNEIISEPEAGFVIEQDYENPALTHQVEMYWQVRKNAGVDSVRPFGVQYRRQVGGPVFTSIAWINGGNLTITGTSGFPEMQLADANATFDSNAQHVQYNMQCQSALWFFQSPSMTFVTTAAGGAGYFQFNVHAGSGFLIASDNIDIRTHAGAQEALIDTNVSGARYYPFADGTGSIGIAANAWSGVFTKALSFPGVALSGTVGAAGGAAALPGTPNGYLVISVNGAA